MTKSYLVEGLSYPNACKLIADLRKEDIDANITTGAVSLQIEETQLEKATEICATYGKKPSEGNQSFLASYIIAGNRMRRMGG